MVDKKTPPVASAKKADPAKDTKTAASAKDVKTAASAKDAKKTAPKDAKKTAPKDAKKTAPKDAKKTAPKDAKKTAPKDAKKTAIAKKTASKNAKKPASKNAKKAALVENGATAEGGNKFILKKGMTTRAIRETHMMVPTKNAKRMVKVNQNKKPTITLRPKRSVREDEDPEKTKARAEKKKERAEKKAAENKDKPKKEVKPTAKKVAPGIKRDLLRRANQLIANRKAYNYTRRAIAVKIKDAPGGKKKIFFKGISKQTIRSMTNPKKKKTLETPKSLKEKKLVTQLVRKGRIANANRQSAMQFDGPEKEKKFTRKLKMTLPHNYLGKYAPRVFHWKLFVGNLPKSATYKHILDAMPEHKKDIKKITMLKDYTSYKNLRHDAEGNPIKSKCNGSAFIEFYSKGPKKMVLLNYKNSIKIHGRTARLYEARPLCKSAKTKIKKEARLRQLKLAEKNRLRAATKKVMQTNLQANKKRFEKLVKSRRGKVHYKTLVRGKDGEVIRVVRNKACKSPKIVRGKLTGMKAKRALCRRSS